MAIILVISNKGSLKKYKSLDSMNANTLLQICLGFEKTEFRIKMMYYFLLRLSEVDGIIMHKLTSICS